MSDEVLDERAQATSLERRASDVHDVRRAQEFDDQRSRTIKVPKLSCEKMEASRRQLLARERETGKEPRVDERESAVGASGSSRYGAQKGSEMARARTGEQDDGRGSRGTEAWVQGVEVSYDEKFFTRRHSARSVAGSNGIGTGRSPEVGVRRERGRYEDARRNAPGVLGASSCAVGLRVGATNARADNDNARELAGQALSGGAGSSRVGTTDGGPISEVIKILKIKNFAGGTWGNQPVRPRLQLEHLRQPTCFST